MKENKYNLDPETEASIEVLLYKDVKNIEDLRKKVIEGSLKCCVVKASLIMDILQIVVAANKALLSLKRNCMTTRTVYSEILFNLSLSKNITQSLTTFGIDDKETNLIFIIIHQKNVENPKENIVEAIEGKACSVEVLREFSNIKLIEKTYKVKGTHPSQMLDLIISKIATKDFLSH